MFYSLLFLTALLSQLKEGSSAATQTRAVAQGSVRESSIAGYNNLVVIGDTAANSGLGDISFSLFNYYFFPDGHIEGNDYIEAWSYAASASASSTYGSVANTLITSAATDLAGNTFKGLGHGAAIADLETVFVSQTSVSEQTGRVVVYKGNATSFTQKQLLIPYDGKHRMDSEAAFGESIAAKIDALAVGCQNCNSSAPVFSGAVYIYKPNKDGSWSESQTLSAEGVLFLGERVSMHEKVLVAAGDTGTGVAARRLDISTKNHQYSDTANTVVVFEEGHHGKYEQRQVITTKSGSFHESITGLTVFDETIAITTMGTDLPSATTATTRDKVYIYYPMNKRYGMEPKGKPSPQQWTNVQILTSSDTADLRYIGAGPDTSISMNSISYLTTDGTNVAIATAQRECLSCKFYDPTVTATSITVAANDYRLMLVSDSTGFYGYQTAGLALGIAEPTQNAYQENCLHIGLEDKFNDGWGIASLVVTDPQGREDRFTSTCTTANPQAFVYCPQTNAPGKYSLHIENGEETPFGWEIHWKVFAGSTWYRGDRHTRMDFFWDEKYNDFHAGATKGLLPLIPTCQVCDPYKPSGKHRSLSNLRALHHKGTTHSPTMSAAPTLLTTGYDGTVWNEFTFLGTDAWFDNHEGANFFISDRDGKHLIREGTRCAAGAADLKCWVDLPDGDYTLRVGDGIQDIEDTTLSFAFCEASNPIRVDTELKFTILDQQCYAGLYTSLSKKCMTNYKADFYLNVDLLLNGGVDSLSISDESSLKIAVSETMISVLGATPSASVLKSQRVTSSGLQLTMQLEFATLPDVTALDNLAKDTTSAASLLKYELIGSQALSTNFLKGEVSSVTILSVSSDSEARNFAKIDESSFKTVEDHVWLTASVDAPSDNFNEYAKYVAEGTYAIVAVAAVLAVSLFAKRVLTKTTVVEEIKA